MIYTGMLGTSYSEFGNIVLGSLTENVQDIMDNSDVHNPVTVLTYKGEEWIAQRLEGTAPEPLYIGWGTGTGELSKGNDVDPDLTLELFEEDTSIDRHEAIMLSQEYWPQDGSGRTVSYIARAVITAVNDIEITEAGLFDAAEGGNLLMHSLFDVISLTGETALNAGDQIIFSFTLDPS